MNYVDSKEQATAFAHQALDLMVAHNIPATPANFEVWYNAHAGCAA